MGITVQVSPYQYTTVLNLQHILYAEPLKFHRFHIQDETIFILKNCPACILFTHGESVVNLS